MTTGRRFSRSSALGDLGAVEADGVGVADAHADGAVRAANDRRDHPAQPGVEIGAHLGGGGAEAGRARRIDAEGERRRVPLEAGVEIDQPRHVADAAGDLRRLAAQRRVVVAEQLDLDRPRRAG